MGFNETKSPSFRRGSEEVMKDYTPIIIVVASCIALFYYGYLISIGFVDFIKYLQNYKVYKEDWKCDKWYVENKNQHISTVISENDINPVEKSVKYLENYTLTSFNTHEISDYVKVIDSFTLEKSVLIPSSDPDSKGGGGIIYKFAANESNCVEWIKIRTKNGVRN